MTDAEHFFVLWSTLANALAWRAIDALVKSDELASLGLRLRAAALLAMAHRWAKMAKRAHQRSREANQRSLVA